MSARNVSKIRYRVAIRDSVSYNSAPAVNHVTSEFEAVLRKDELIIRPTKKYGENEMMEIVRPFLLAWEAQIGLAHRPGNIRFELAEIEFEGLPQTSSFVTTMTADAVLTKSYEVIPEPPTSFLYSPEVEHMFERYRHFCDGKESLTSMAYFCLTVLERHAGSRSAVCSVFSIEKPVRDMLGDLVSEHGAPTEARKAATTYKPLTAAERQWIIDTVKRLINQAGAYFFDPKRPLKVITMADLPPLK